LSYLKVFNAKLLDNIKDQFNLVVLSGKITKPLSGNKPKASKSSPFKRSAMVPTFDTTSGDLIDCPQSVKYSSREDTLYVFQELKINDSTALTFFDSGATGNLVLGKLAESAGFKVLDPKTQLIGVLGDQSLYTEYGVYTARLGPDVDGAFHELVFQGIQDITSSYPRYDLSTIIREVEASGKLPPDTILPNAIGGSPVDILIGVKNPELVPKLLFWMPSGIGVFKSAFFDVNFSNIAFGGSHHSITAINQKAGTFTVNQLSVMLLRLAQQYSGAPWMDLELTPHKQALPKFFPMSELQNSLSSATPISGLDLAEFQPENLPLPTIVLTSCPLHLDYVSSSCQHCCSAPSETAGTSTSCQGQTSLDSALKTKVPLSKTWNLMEPDEEIVNCQCGDCWDYESSNTVSSCLKRSAQKLMENSVKINYKEKRVLGCLPLTEDPGAYTHQPTHFYIHHLLGEFGYKMKFIPTPETPITKSFSSSVLSREEARFELLKTKQRTKSQAIEPLIDIIYIGLARSNIILAKATLICNKLFHNCHLRSKISQVRLSLSQLCTLCLLSDGFINKLYEYTQNVTVASDSHHIALVKVLPETDINQHWNALATQDCRGCLTLQDLVCCETNPHTGIPNYKGRLDGNQKILFQDCDSTMLKFFDEFNFSNPCIFPDIPIFLAFAIHVPFDAKFHSGIESTLMNISMTLPNLLDCHLNLFYIFRMSEPDLIERARDYHMASRVKSLSGYKPYPLLSPYVEVKFDFNSYFQNLCGYSCCHGIEECYMEYISKCDEKPGMIYCPLKLDMLPGCSPVLDHICTLLDDQPTDIAGGSFKPFIQDTLFECINHRQMRVNSHPKTRSLVFGRSSKIEFDKFISSFNNRMDDLAVSRLGHLPTNFFHFDVEYVYGLDTNAFTLLNHPKELKNPLVLDDNKMPARIVLGLWEERWEIVFPWVAESELNGNFAGNYYLSTPKNIPDYWVTFFGKLHGYAVGLDLDVHTSNLSKFLSQCYKFANCDGTVKIKVLDLISLLALAGVNLSPVSIPTLSYYFTGSVPAMPQEFLVGFGRFSDCNGLPWHLNAYLQTKSMIIMNVSVISCICVLLNLFPTPGIAGLTTKMTPFSFLRWFSQFIPASLCGASLPVTVLAKGDRSDDFRSAICVIRFLDDANPYFSSSQLSLLAPPWNSVVFGGCPTDQVALTYLLTTVYPIVCQRGVPPHLRWNCNITILQGLFGQPTSQTHSGELLGCGFDQAIPELPDFCDPLYNVSKPLITMCRKYRAELSSDSPLKEYTVNQIMLLYLWKYPVSSRKMYALTLGLERDDLVTAGVTRMFHSDQISLAAPIIFAYVGDDAVYPDFFKPFMQKRKVKLTEKKIRKLSDRYERSNQPLVKAEALKHLRNFVVKKCKLPKPVFDTVISQRSLLTKSQSHSSTILDVRLLDSSLDCESDPATVALSPAGVDALLRESDLESISSGELEVPDKAYRPESPTHSETDLILEVPNMDVEDLLKSSSF
jgi:hypothetical protein